MVQETAAETSSNISSLQLGVEPEQFYRVYHARLYAINKSVAVIANRHHHACLQVDDVEFAEDLCEALNFIRWKRTQQDDGK